MNSLGSFVAKDMSLGAGQAFAAILQDCVMCGLILVGRDGRAVALNEEAARIMRIGPKQSGGELPPQLAEIAEEVRRHSTRIKRSTVLTQENADSAVARVAAAPASPAGTVVMAVNQFSPSGPLEPDLERLDRLASIGTVFAGMAHEVKNALVAVKTFVDLLLEGNPDAELAGMVRTEMSRIDSIVGGLLKFARPAPPVRQRVSLHETLEYALRLIQPQFSTNAITVQRGFNASPDQVMGDESQLQQAFVNLLLNACEAMGSAGTVRVDTISAPGEGQTGRVRVDIADTGPGISRENLKRMFEPFFTTKADGTGLGLAVTRRIILDHGGNITVDSEEGKGAVVTVTLPAFEGT